MKRKILLFGVLYACCMFLSLNMNSKYKVNTYKSTLWADAAGYYVYLPATIIYAWNEKEMPDDIDSLTGRGFSFTKKEGRLFTKYTAGVSYFQLPFFLTAHAYCKLSGINADGFGDAYVKSMLFSGVFYMLLALFLLYAVLSRYYTQNAALFTCLALVLCTNLYYYGIEHNGMSHVYSFFLISLVLYLLQHFRPSKLLILLPALACIILIRPTSIILIIPITGFILNLKHKNILASVLNRYTLPGVILAVLMLIPQFVYWHYSSGKWLMYSYGNESFIYKFAPKIKEVLFAPLNGFLTYAPIFIPAFIAMFGGTFNKKLKYSFLLGFSVLLYMNASWWSWQFGCAYGARAFIEYYPFLAFGLAAAMEYILKKKTMRNVNFLIILLLAAYNLLFIYGYDDCWDSGVWDYKNILKILSDTIT